MNLDLNFTFARFLGPFVGVSSSSKKNLCEVDVHTVYQRLFKKLANARYTPCNTFLLILHALYRLQT